MRTQMRIFGLIGLLAVTLAAQSQYPVVAGSLTASNSACTATACVSLAVQAPTNSVLVQVAGSFTATTAFEATVDGTNYAAIAGYPVGGGAPASSATAAGIWQIPATGMKTIRARVSSFSSGPVSVALTRSTAQVYAAANLTIPAAASLSSMASAGAVSGTTGTFSGAVAGTTGTFSGAVSGTTGTFSGAVSGTTGAFTGAISEAGANGQKAGIKVLEELTTIAAAATTDTTIQIPANSIVLAVTVRVTTAIPTASTFTVIGTTSSTAFQVGSNVAVTLNTTDLGTKACPYLNGAAQTIRITPDQTPGANTGRVRVSIFYIEITPPTA